MKNGIALLAVFLLLIVATGLATQYTQAQPSEEEAKQIFESLGCISCHVGKPRQPASSWDLIIQYFQDWSQKYPNIDEAIKNEVVYYGNQKFNSFDELMERMASNVGKDPNDPDIVKLKEFFRSFWGEVATETQTQTPEETQTATMKETTQETTQETATPESPTATSVRGGEEPREGVILTVVGIALIILITIVAAVYLTKR